MTPAAIRAARETLGLTQAQLSAVMGVRVMTVSQWERGERDPLGPAVRLLRAYLDGYRPADWPSAPPSACGHGSP